MSNATIVSIIYVLVIMGLFFLIIFLPERKRKKNYGNMMSSLRVNDEVLTRGGIIGKVINIQDKFVIIQTGPDQTKIKIIKAAVEKIMNKKIEENK